MEPLLSKAGWPSAHCGQPYLLIPGLQGTDFGVTKIWVLVQALELTGCVSLCQAATFQLGMIEPLSLG